MLNDSKNKMLGSIVPLFVYLLTKIKQSSLKIDHRVPYFAHKIDLRRPSRKIIKSDFEFKLSILKQSIAYKNNSMPGYINQINTLNVVELWHDVDTELR